MCDDDTEYADIVPMSTEAINVIVSINSKHLRSLRYEICRYITYI